MIAVAGGKGGSGKTTTTLGVARALVRSDRADGVVAVDADWDLPNLARLANTTGEGSGRVRRPTIVDAVGTDGSVDTRTPGPTVLAAPDDPGAHNAHELLRRLDGEAVWAVDGQTDSSAVTVLADCPAGASPDAAAPLRAADRSILVTPLRPAALRDTVKTAAMARALDCPPLGVVVIRTESAPNRLAEVFDCPVLGTVPSAPPTPLADRAVRAAYGEVADSLPAASGTGASPYRQSQSRTDNR